MILETPTSFTPGGSTCFHEMVDSMADWIQRGGPRPEDYGELNRMIRRLGDEIRAGTVSPEWVQQQASQWARGALRGTLQAKALTKPYGYSGDFEMIDAIHTLRVAEGSQQRRWDQFFQSQAAPVAVRNRKIWFQQQLSRAVSDHSPEHPLRVLNVGSGPARDVWEWMLSHPSAPLQMDCVDMDPHAIAFSESLCAAWPRQVHFHHRNVLKSLPGQSYELIWCAGLFDYLKPRVAAHLLKALYAVLEPGGSLTVGNFSPFNPSRDYMELLGDWHLIHRSEEDLRRLAEDAGIGAREISIDWEPEGVNLFLRIQRSR